MEGNYQTTGFTNMNNFCAKLETTREMTGHPTSLSPSIRWPNSRI